MSPNFLQLVAERMYAEAERDGQASRTLTGGLHLLVWYVGDDRMLALQRDDVPPSPVEIVTCRRDFAVPADAEQLATGRFVGLYWMVRPVAAPVPEPEQMTLV